MKSIYILDDYYLSAGSGIGTYLKNLVICASSLEEVKISVIELRTNESEFRICQLHSVEYLLLPAIHERDYPDHSEKICESLRLHIKDGKENIFMFNYAPADLLMQMLRTDFPLSRFIFTVHDMSWTAPLLGEDTLLRKILTQRSNQTLPKEKLPAFLPLFDREIRQFRSADQVVCLSTDTYRILQAYYQVPKEKIFLIPNGLDDKIIHCSPKEKTKLKQKMYLREDEQIILMIGRVSQAKGSFAYLNAFKQILKTIPSCRLVIIGEIYNPAQVMEITKSIAAKVIFTGKLYTDELNRWLRIADMGVIPSYSEQCSYVGLEMMRARVPVVASDGFGVRTMFQKGINACVAPIGNRKHPDVFEKNLAEATLELLKDEQSRVKIGKKGRQVLKQQFSLSVMKKKYEELWLRN